MTNCAQCGKKVGFFELKRNSDFSGNTFCSFECRSKFHKKKKEEKQKDKEIESNGMIKEIKCKWNQCKHAWHYLESDEKKLKNQATGNALIGAGMCCNPFGALFSNKSIDLQRELEKMKRCPKCNSMDITKTPIYHEKKS